MRSKINRIKGDFNITVHVFNNDCEIMQTQECCRVDKIMYKNEHLDIVRKFVERISVNVSFVEKTCF